MSVWIVSLTSECFWVKTSALKESLMIEPILNVIIISKLGIGLFKKWWWHSSAKKECLCLQSNEHLIINCWIFKFARVFKNDRKYNIETVSKTNQNLYHGTIIQIGITCNKISCYMRDSDWRWLIDENAKVFQSCVKYFLNCRILIGLCKWVFINHPIIFLDRDNKTKLVPASFSYLL